MVDMTTMSSGGATAETMAFREAFRTSLFRLSGKLLTYSVALGP